jgi:hypothetical protein
LAAARLAGRVPTRTVILVGHVAALAAGTAALLIGALWLDTPLILAVICFFVLMSGHACPDLRRTPRRAAGSTRRQAMPPWYRCQNEPVIRAAAGNHESRVSMVV